jgi:transposase
VVEYFSSCDSIGDKLATVLAELGRWTLDIVRRPAAAEGFVILPRRWVVERTFAWLGRCRRPAKNAERRPKARPPEHSPPTCAA